jgi:hypothetical protein
MEYEIHKTHSKSDLIKVIETFDLFDDDFKYKDLEKQNLQYFLIDSINKMKEIDLDNKLFIDDIDELKEYLINPNPTKIPIKDKQFILKTAKNINYYFKTNELRFKDVDEMIQIGREISVYGDCPSVRKAIDKLNNHYNSQIELKITPKVLFDIIEKKEAKDSYKPKTKFINKEITISFD